MTSLRKFIYAALLAVSALSLAPALASAQESRGQFTLTHSVLWEKALVPAGEYQFNFKAEGPTGVLTLSKLDSPHAGFMFLVTDTEAIQPAVPSKLVLSTIAAGSYVSTMILAENGVALHFTAPPQNAEKMIAKAPSGTFSAAR
jgi:hypothetical protein